MAIACWEDLSRASPGRTADLLTQTSLWDGFVNLTSAIKLPPCGVEHAIFCKMISTLKGNQQAA